MSYTRTPPYTATLADLCDGRFDPPTKPAEATLAEMDAIINEVQSSDPKWPCVTGSSVPPEMQYRRYLVEREVWRRLERRMKAEGATDRDRDRWLDSELPRWDAPGCADPPPLTDAQRYAYRDCKSKVDYLIYSTGYYGREGTDPETFAFEFMRIVDRAIARAIADAKEPG